MKHVNYLLLLIPTMFFFSCLKKDNLKIGEYSPIINTSEDITIELNRFKNVFRTHSNTIDTTKNDGDLSFAIERYTSTYDQLPVLKEKIQVLSTNSGWPWGVDESSASYHRLIASQKLVVIDSLILANKAYNASLNQINTLKGDSLILIYNDSKDFLANPSFRGTSDALISSKYVRLKKSPIVEQLSYIQYHPKKSQVFSMLNNLPDIYKVWKFSDATSGSYILKSNLESLASDSALVSYNYKAVLLVENARTIYDTYYLATNYNPITKRQIAFNILTDFASVEKHIIEAAKTSKELWLNINLLKDSLELVKAKKNEIIALLPSTENQTKYINAYTTHFPQLVDPLKAAFRFSSSINTILNWGTRLESLKQATEPFYISYANKDTIIGDDRQLVIQLGTDRISLITDYLDENLGDYFGFAYNDLIDPLNQNTLGGKITFLVDLTVE